MCSQDGCTSSIPTANRELGKVSFLGWNYNGMCLSKHQRVCVSPLLDPKTSALASRPVCNWAVLPDEVPMRLDSQEGSFNWGPQHQQTWVLGDFTLVLEARSQATVVWVHEGFWSPAWQTRKYRFKSGVSEGHSAMLCRPHTSPALEMKPAQFPGIGILAQVKELQGMCVC